MRIAGAHTRAIPVLCARHRPQAPPTSNRPKVLCCQRQVTNREVLKRKAVAAQETGFKQANSAAAIFLREGDLRRDAGPQTRRRFCLEFRPELNAARMNASAKLLARPVLARELFIAGRGVLQGQELGIIILGAQSAIPSLFCEGFPADVRPPSLLTRMTARKWS